MKGSLEEMSVPIKSKLSRPNRMDTFVFSAKGFFFFLRGNRLLENKAVSERSCVSLGTFASCINISPPKRQAALKTWGGERRQYICKGRVPRYRAEQAIESRSRDPYMFPDFVRYTSVIKH